MAVLDGEPDGIGKVNDHERSEPHRSHEGIPIGTQHLANPVVGVFREDERKVHTPVEQQEENQCEAGNTHYELTADGRVSLPHNVLVLVIYLMIFYLSRCIFRAPIIRLKSAYPLESVG